MSDDICEKPCPPMVVCLTGTLPVYTYRHMVVCQVSPSTVNTHTPLYPVRHIPIPPLYYRYTDQHLSIYTVIQTYTYLALCMYVPHVSCALCAIYSDRQVYWYNTEKHCAYPSLTWPCPGSLYILTDRYTGMAPVSATIRLTN